MSWVIIYYDTVGNKGDRFRRKFVVFFYHAVGEDILLLILLSVGNTGDRFHLRFEVFPCRGACRHHGEVGEAPVKRVPSSKVGLFDRRMQRVRVRRRYVS